MYPMEHKTLPHPTIIKKMKTFLEVEGKMGPVPQPVSSQDRPPQPNTNLNVRKDNATEKRKRAAPTKRLRPSTAPKPSETAMQPPTTVSKAPFNVNPQTDASENRPPPLENAPVCESTPWPGAGRMSGNLFEDRKWLLPPKYLNNDCKNATRPKSLVKEEPKTGGQSVISMNAENCGWGPNCPFCKNQEKEDWDGNHQSQLQHKVPPPPEVQRPQARCPQTLNYHIYICSEG